MRITPVNNTNYRNNQQAFGMRIHFMDEEAFTVAQHIFPKVKLEKVMPDVVAIKTKNGEEILVEVWGDKKNEALKFNASAEGETEENVVLSSISGQSTYGTKGTVGDDVFDDFMPTLQGIKSSLDKKISESETAKYFKKMFGQ